ncbi:nucleotide exchange factor GrpE [Halobaculum sp. MBLA0143]|uniref:nucleotide exchange factor GrpE n=1 Tax=Halobaculum sp. MBLA0143 TaxID=3079933 RepID=UPI00352402E5
MSENAGTEQDTEREADGDEQDERSELVARVAAHDEELATAVEDRITEAETAADDARERAEELESSLARTRADFENYKDRAEKRREQAATRATADLVEKLTDVRNNLLRALDQEADADIRPGVESTLETFDRVLEEEGVTPIEPEPGTEVDPERHEVMVRVASPEPEDTVAEVYDPGYETDDTVIEAAKVTVSDGSGDDGDSEESDGGDSE